MSLPGFSKVTPEKSKSNRLIVSITGEQKTGKTHFALTAPGPIAYFDLDIGTEGVIHKFAGDKEILAKRFLFDDKASEIVAKLFEEFKKDYYAALNAPKIKTIVIDTMSDVWEFIRLARFGKLTQIMPVRYAEVNSEMRKFIRDAFLKDKTLILLHKVREEYKNNSPTGKMKIAGFSEVPFLVQVNLETFIDPEVGNSFRFVDCRQNPELRGLELPAMDFDQVLEMVYQ